MNNEQPQNYGVEKVAIVLLAMEKENSDKILSMMEEGEKGRIIKAMSRVTNVSSETVESIVDKFSTEITNYLDTTTRIRDET
jgi:flagellar motor switch protein FliG